MNITYTDKVNLHKLAEKSLIKHTGTLLEIGTGINPQNFIIPKTHICCEPYQEYISVLQKKIKTEILLFLKD